MSQLNLPLSSLSALGSVVLAVLDWLSIEEVQANYGRTNKSHRQFVLSPGFRSSRTFLTLHYDITDSDFLMITQMYPSLRILKCSRSKFSKKRTRALRCLTRLTSVDLTFSNLSQQEPCLFMYIPYRNLVSLRLDRCMITDHFGELLAKGSCDLIELALFDCSELTPKFIEHIQNLIPQLKTLHLEGCGRMFEGPDAGEAEKILSSATSLTKLNLGRLQITDASLLLLCSCPLPLLTELSLYYNQAMTDAAMSAVGACMFNLVSINLHCCALTDEGLIDLVGKLPRLEKFWAENCTQFTDASVIAVADNCPNIREFMLGAYGAVTQQAINYLRQKATKLVLSSFMPIPRNYFDDYEDEGKRNYVLFIPTTLPRNECLTEEKTSSSSGSDNVVSFRVNGESRREGKSVREEEDDEDVDSGLNEWIRIGLLKRECEPLLRNELATIITGEFFKGFIADLEKYAPLFPGASEDHTVNVLFKHPVLRKEKATHPYRIEDDVGNPADAAWWLVEDIEHKQGEAPRRFLLPRHSLKRIWSLQMVAKIKAERVKSTVENMQASGAAKKDIAAAVQKVCMELKNWADQRTDYVTNMSVTEGMTQPPFLPGFLQHADNNVVAQIWNCLFASRQTPRSVLQTSHRSPEGLGAWQLAQFYLGDHGDGYPFEDLVTLAWNCSPCTKVLQKISMNYPHLKEILQHSI